MSTVLSEGTARNIVGRKQDDAIVPIPDERRYVTFLNELGAVHTIIVDAEHAAKDAEELLRWFNHTRASVTLRSRSPETSSRHLDAAEVIRLADEALSFASRETSPPAPSSTSSSGEGQ